MTGYPLTFINSFINLRGPERIGDIVFIHIEIAFIHLRRGPAAGTHDGIN